MSGPPDAALALQQPEIGTQDLHRVLSPHRAIAALSARGLSDIDIATAVGATDRSVRRWRSGADPASPTRYRNQIDDLRMSFAVLLEGGTLGNEGAVHWLRARNRDLDDGRPLDALRAGQFDRVRAAALAFLGEDAGTSRRVP